MSTKAKQAPTAFDEPDTHVATATIVPHDAGNTVVVMSGRGPRTVTACTIMRQLTPSLVAMAHEGDMLFEVASEVYEVQLPVKGRSETMQPAIVIDGYRVETGEYVTLICNAMIVSAFQRAGAPLKGRTFALRNHDMMADKAYRHIEVVEVQLETEPTITE